MKEINVMALFGAISNASEGDVIKLSDYEVKKKYRYVIYDKDGYLDGSDYEYNSYEEAEEEALRNMDRIIRRCEEENENPMLRGFSIEEKEIEE